MSTPLVSRVDHHKIDGEIVKEMIEKVMAQKDFKNSYT